MRTMLRNMSAQELLKVAASSTARLRNGARLLDRVLNANLADAGVVPRNALAVAIGKSSLSFAYATALLSRLKVERIVTVPFTGVSYPSPDEVASEAVRVKEELSLETVDTRMIIPKAWALVRPVELPLAAQENLDNIISYEMDRLSPFSAEEVYYDYYIVGRDEQRIKLLLSVTKRETIESYLKALSEKGINVKGVAIDLLEAAGLHRDDNYGVSVFLKIDDEGIEGCSVVHGRVTAVLPNIAVGFAGHTPEKVSRAGTFVGSSVWLEPSTLLQVSSFGQSRRWKHVSHGK